MASRSRPSAAWARASVIRSSVTSRATPRMGAAAACRPPAPGRGHRSGRPLGPGTRNETSKAPYWAALARPRAPAPECSGAMREITSSPRATPPPPQPSITPVTSDITTVSSPVRHSQMPQRAPSTARRNLCSGLGLGDLRLLDLARLAHQRSDSTRPIARGASRANIWFASIDAAPPWHVATAAMADQRRRPRSAHAGRRSRRPSGSRAVTASPGLGGAGAAAARASAEAGTPAPSRRSAARCRASDLAVRPSARANISPLSASATQGLEIRRRDQVLAAPARLGERGGVARGRSLPARPIQRRRPERRRRPRPPATAAGCVAGSARRPPPAGLRRRPRPPREPPGLPRRSAASAASEARRASLEPLSPGGQGHAAGGSPRGVATRGRAAALACRSRPARPVHVLSGG